MTVSKSIQSKILENSKEISRLLAENEELLREEGLNLPEENYSTNRSDRICIPNYYIRTNDKFISKYHLKEICSNTTIVKNVAYTFQLTDFYNYLINRFFIWGSVESLLLKNGIILLVSIIETLILECANNICNNSSSCDVTDCKNHFNKEERNNIMKALHKLCELNIVSISKEEIDEIDNYVQLRNYVHIRLNTENEFMSEQFNIEKYNNLLNLLIKIDEDIYKNGCKLYGKCDDN